MLNRLRLEVESVATSNPLVGCAFLSKPSSLQSGGWACLHGGEPFTFSTLETLGSRGDLWVTSAPPSAFFVEGGGDYSFLRHADFLATPVNFIAQELGFGTNEMTGEAAKAVSEVLTRVVGMAGVLCGEIQARLINEQMTVVAAIQTVAAPALRYEEMPKELSEAMPQLFKAPPPIASLSAQGVTVRVPANRLRLAQVVHMSAVPAGTWTQVDMSQYPNGSALSWAIGNQQPVLANVTIRGPLARVKAAAPLSRNMTAGTTNRWMALPEIVALSRVVDMAPKQMFVASEFVPTEASLRVPPPFFSPAAAASVSANLFAEAYMHAVCAASNRRDLDDVTSQVYSVRAAWLTAVARSYMMQEAMALAEANINVLGYNNSHVLVSVSRGNLRTLRKAIAASSLLSYPTALRKLEDSMIRPLAEVETSAANWEA